MLSLTSEVTRQKEKKSLNVLIQLPDMKNVAINGWVILPLP